MIQLQARFCDPLSPFALHVPCKQHQVVPPKRWTSLHMGSWYLYIILYSCFSKCEFPERTFRLVLLGNAPWEYLMFTTSSEWSSDKTSHCLPALCHALWHVEGPKIVANLQRTNGRVLKIRIPKPLWWKMQNTTNIIHLLVFVAGPQFWAIHLAGWFCGLAVAQLHRTLTPCMGKYTNKL